MPVYIWRGKNVKINYGCKFRNYLGMEGRDFE
jgi:hypothetical protein